MSAAEADDEPPARSVWRLLCDPLFGPFIIGKSLANLGVWVHSLVAAVLAYDISGSAVVVSMVSVAQFTPQIALAPLTGAMADRGSRRGQLILGRGLAATGAGLMSGWLVLLGTDSALPMLMATSLLLGLGSAVGGPAMNAMGPDLVRPEELSPAVTLSTAPVTLGRAVGPGLGAILSANIGPGGALGIAALGHLAFVCILLAIRDPTEDETSGARRSSVRSGMAWVWRDKALRRLLIGVGAVGIGADPSVTLVPVMAAALDQPSTFAGTLASAFGVGAVLGLAPIGPLTRWLGVQRCSTLGLALIAAGWSGAATLDSAWPVLICFALAGAGMSMAIASLSTQVLDSTPNAYRGRVMALWSVAFLGTRPLAAAMNGALAEHLSLQTSLAATSGIVVGAIWVCRVRRG